MKLKKMVSDLGYSAAAAITVMALSAPAHAQVGGGGGGNTIGGKAAELKTQFGQLGQAVVAGAFFVGIIMVITGLIKLKTAADNPNQAKYSDGLWRLAVGAGLIAVPAVTGILENASD